jgi:hypothetical protein
VQYGQLVHEEACNIFWGKCVLLYKVEDGDSRFHGVIRIFYLYHTETSTQCE